MQPSGQGDGRTTATPWSAGLTIAISGLVVFNVVRFAQARADWLVAFAGDAWRWLEHPQVAAAPAPPTGLASLLPLFVLVGAEGWLAARIVLVGTDLDGERWFESGLAVTLGVSILGLGGVIGAVTGHLERPTLLVFYAAVGVPLLVGWRWVRRRNARPRPTLVEAATCPPILRITARVVVAVCLGFCFLHAVWSPVIDWDATIYHAETARVWFLERPDPAVRFGPSIGIEISGNYPPLFPAAGAAVYTVLGRFDDVYLRVLPPILLAATLAMVFGFARRRDGPSTAYIAVLLGVAAPLLLIYGALTTEYMLLAALTTATVALGAAAVDADRRRVWIGAGAVGGLAVLSHVYGVLALLAPLAALVAYRPRRWRGAVWFWMAAAVVASPWLLRNAILLGDPFYPLASPPFAGRGLVPSLWNAARIGIRGAALTSWLGAQGWRLRLRELGTALLGTQVLVPGCYFAIWFGLVRGRRSPRAAYLALFLGGFVLALLLQGWYWLRALVPLAPVAALLTAPFLLTLVRPTVRPGLRSSRLDAVAGVVGVTTVAFTVAVISIVGPGLAVAGPLWSQRGPPADLLNGVREWGAPGRQLWDAFGDDVLMWRWIDEHVPPTERFATLEIRTYYLDHPENAFYLDGVEAAPLLHLSKPAEIERFLVAHRIGYVVIPAWADHPATPTNVQGLLPLFRYLGGPRFPPVAVFPAGLSGDASVIYSVGPARDAPRVGLVTVDRAGPGPVDRTSATFVAGDPSNRILVPAPRFAPMTLRFEYDAAHGAVFHPSLLAQVGSRRLPFAEGPTAQPGFRSVSVFMPASREAVLDIVLAVERSDLSVRDVHLAPASGVEVFHDGMVSTSGAVGLAARDGAHVFVPAPRGITPLSFEYRARTSGRLKIFERRTTGSWSTRIDRPVSANDGWQRERIRLTTAMPGYVELSIETSRSPVWIRAVHVEDRYP